LAAIWWTMLTAEPDGPAAIVFAATRPERTRALILTSTFSFAATGWDDIDRDLAELGARVLAELGEDYTPSTDQMVGLQEFGRAVLSGWGSGAALTFEAAFWIVVRPILPTLTAPTLVIHAREDPTVAVQYGRYLADHIPGARYLEVEGMDSLLLLDKRQPRGAGWRRAGCRAYSTPAGGPTRT
jgi:pimeloyl-ACP methyl ester carboxylesterase